MTKVKIKKVGTCLSCGSMSGVLQVSIGRTEQAMADINVCHRCLFEMAIKADLKILATEEGKKKLKEEIGGKNV